jgi:hypothetical protein
VEQRIRFSYLGIVPNGSLERSVRARAAQLPGWSELHVHLERWERHHRTGSSYKVRFEGDFARGEGWKEESAFADELHQAIQDVCERTARRFAHAHESIPSVAHSPISEEARRLLPLHGWFPEAQPPARMEDDER